jgi:hypothetical protein
VARKKFRVSQKKLLEQRLMKLVRILVRTTTELSVRASIVSLIETTCLEQEKKFSVATKHLTKPSEKISQKIVSFDYPREKRLSSYSVA